MWKDKIALKALDGLVLLVLILWTPAMGKELSINFTDGQYVKDEWVVSLGSMSARYIPHERHPVSYIIQRQPGSKITRLGMTMQLCTTIGAARANVYIACGGSRDGFKINTYPHEQLWKNTRQWQMSDHCLEILNKRGELQLVINVNWDGHGVFLLSDLKMDVEQNGAGLENATP
ncbi:hypothetical protein [Desulfocicer niacini]